MHLLVDHDDAVAGWVGRRIGVPVAPPYTALGWLDADGTLSVGFVFHSYTLAGNIDIAVAASGRFTRGIFRAVANYVFEQIPATRITARTPVTNETACSILKRIGFVQECVCKRYYADVDAAQFRMLKSEAKRWLQ